MLGISQVARLVLLSVGLWIAATLYIRFVPSAFTNPLSGALGFVTTGPVAWLSVWLIQAIGRLARDQLLVGVAVVGAVAMMIDGAALRWWPELYGADPLAVRLGAAWLLWGYGVSLAVALALTRRKANLSASTQ